MSDHESPTQPAGEDPSLTPATRHPAPSPTPPTRSRPLAESPFLFGRKKAAGTVAEPESDGAEAAPVSADGYPLGPDPEPNPPGRIFAADPLAQAPARQGPPRDPRRRRGPGVVPDPCRALLLNRGPKTDADEADAPSASGTVLALNTDDSKPKDDLKPKDEPKPKDPPPKPVEKPAPSVTPPVSTPVERPRRRRGRPTRPRSPSRSISCPRRVPATPTHHPSPPTPP